MNLKIWSRTILSVQKYLERICSSIDACIDKKINASCFVTTKNMSENSSEVIADWIINMSERKVNLINLNVICITALKNIDKTYAKILALKYFDAMPCKEIIELLNLTERTFFRKLLAAHQEFENYLSRNGYNANFFAKMLENEGWITEIYYENQKALEETGKERVVEFTPYFLEKIASRI